MSFESSVLRLLVGLFVMPFCMASLAVADHHGGDHAENGHASEADHSEGEAGHGGGHGEGHGSVTDTLVPDAKLAFWTLVTFGIFVVVLSKLAWGPLKDGLDARESGIRADIDKAEQARVKAESMLAEHQAKLDAVQGEVKELLDEARRDADVAKGQILQTANEEAERISQRAMTDIGRARDQALKEIFDASADRVADATEKVLGRGLSGDDERRLIDEALSSLGSKA